MRQLNQREFCGWCGGRVVYGQQWMSQCPDCGYKNYINPNPCGAVVVAAGPHILLTKRAIEPGLGRFDLPGGFMDMTDQTIESTVLRELEEELAITEDMIDSPVYLGSTTMSYPYQETEFNNIVFYFVCKLRADKKSIVINRSEISETIWATKSDLANIDLAWSADKRILVERYFSKFSI